jgi:hypothetical protein
VEARSKHEIGLVAGRQDAAGYGRQDACRYQSVAMPKCAARIAIQFLFAEPRARI